MERKKWIFFQVFVSTLIPHLLIGLLPFALALAALQVMTTNNETQFHSNNISGVLQQEQMPGEAKNTNTLEVWCLACISIQ